MKKEVLIDVKIPRFFVEVLKPDLDSSQKKQRLSGEIDATTLEPAKFNVPPCTR